MGHLACSLEPSAGMPGHVWVGGAWDVNTEDPGPCGGPSPTSLAMQPSTGSKPELRLEGG